MAKKAPGASLANTLPSPRGEDDPVDNYETQGHLRTLVEAHGILNDPEKMTKVHKLAGRHQKALSGIRSVEDLKSTYKKKFGVGAIAQSAGVSKTEDTDHGDSGTGKDD